jgi:hypothetical protein
MEWFYALNGQQVGPVSESQFEALIRAGTINNTTLVWRNGLVEWQPLQMIHAGAPSPEAVSPASSPTLSAGAATQYCAECRRTFPESELVFLNRAWVCAGCKPVFVQRLKEGAGPVGGQLWRFGKQLVLRSQTPLPDRCVKCNAPANGNRLRRRLYWHSPAFYALILINLLVYALVALIVRKRAVLEIGLCEHHRRRRRLVIVSSWAVVLAGFAMVGAGISANEGMLIVLGILLALIAAIVGGVLGPQVAAAKIDKEFVYLRGCSQEYLALLPEWSNRF